jgi:hypothetical protein
MVAWEPRWPSWRRIAHTLRGPRGMGQRVPVGGVADALLGRARASHARIEDTLHRTGRGCATGGGRPREHGSDGESRRVRGGSSSSRPAPWHVSLVGAG